MTEPPAPTIDIHPTVTGSLAIRRAAVADAGTVLTLMVELADFEGTASAVRSTVEDWRRMLASPGVLVLLAYVGDQPVGYLSGTRQLNLWIGGDIFAMDDLYVRAGARDHGVGGHLMAARAEHVEDVGPVHG
jgi:GNAT superfamily N-acetyltransferase